MIRFRFAENHFHREVFQDPRVGSGLTGLDIWTACTSATRTLASVAYLLVECLYSLLDYKFQNRVMLVLFPLMTSAGA